MIYDDFAKRIADDYSLFLLSLEANYRAIVGPGVQITPSVISDFNKGAANLSSIFIELANREIDAYMASLGVEAPESIIDAKFALMVGLRKAVIENCTQMGKLLRAGALGYGNVIKQAHGSLGLLLQKKLGAVRFNIYDNSGRKWEAKSLVTVVARDFAYQTWIDVTIAVIRAEGFEYGQVKYDDSAKADKEIVVSMSADRRVFTTIGTIRREVFHMNSTARLVPYV